MAPSVLLPSLLEFALQGGSIPHVTRQTASKRSRPRLAAVVETRVSIRTATCNCSASPCACALTTSMTVYITRSLVLCLLRGCSCEFHNYINRFCMIMQLLYTCSYTCSYCCINIVVCVCVNRVPQHTSA